MATARNTITDEELLRLPKDGNKYEVVDGELRMSPAGLPHERIIARLIVLLGSFVKERELGDVLGSNVLYVLPSGNKRGPVVSFIAAARAAGVRDAVFPSLAPDLAVEILSPGQSPRRMLDKLGEYLEAGHLSGPDALPARDPLPDRQAPRPRGAAGPSRPARPRRAGWAGGAERSTRALGVARSRPKRHDP